MDNTSTTSLQKISSKADVIIFSSQVLLLVIVVVTSLINLSLDNGNTNLWTMILTSCLGYMMPNPRLKSSSQLTKVIDPSETAARKDKPVHAGGHSDNSQDGVILRESSF